MNPDEQRLSIAEACGWKRIAKPENEMEEAGSAFIRMEWWDIAYLPDYLNDLNAMHEAEKVILNNAKDYCEWLDKVVGHHNELYSLTFATAAQRAEAFLKTIGKWRDE